MPFFNCKFRVKLLSAAIFISLLCACRPAAADESPDRFLLPETPPTIERFSVPRLDQPILKKQNFISESSIEPSQIWRTPAVEPLAAGQFPFAVELSRGSFGSSKGALIFKSLRGWQLTLEQSHSDGESARLSAETSALGIVTGYAPFPEAHLVSELNYRQGLLWDQAINEYNFEQQALYLAGHAWALKASAKAARTEIVQSAVNEQYSGMLSLGWQPLAGNEAVLSVAYDKDTAFGFDNISRIALKYGVSVLPAVVVTAGVKNENSVFQPYADTAVQVFPRVRCKVTYAPGIDMPSWSDIYITGRYVAVNTALKPQQSPFSLSEELSWYWGDGSSCAIAFHQKDTVDYIFNSPLPGSDALLPGNMERKYHSLISGSLTLAYNPWNAHLSFAHNAVSGVPLLPEYGITASLDYSFKRWTFGFDCSHVGETPVSFSPPVTLAPYFDAGCTITRTFETGIEVYAAGKNLLGQSIELQPGFLQRATRLETGLRLKF